MAEAKTRAVEVTVTILAAACGVFAAIGIFEAQEHHNAVGWFTVCAISLIAAVLIPITVFVLFPWIERLSEGQRPAIAITDEQHEPTPGLTENVGDATDHDREIAAGFLKALPPHNQAIIWLKEEFISKSMPLKHVDLLDKIYSGMRLNVIGFDDSEVNEVYERLRDAIGEFLNLAQFNLFTNPQNTALQKSSDWPWEQWKKASDEINAARGVLVTVYDKFLRICHQKRLD